MKSLIRCRSPTDIWSLPIRDLYMLFLMTPILFRSVSWLLPSFHFEHFQCVFCSDASSFVSSIFIVSTKYYDHFVNIFLKVSPINYSSMTFCRNGMTKSSDGIRVTLGVQEVFVFPAITSGYQMLCCIIGMDQVEWLWGYKEYSYSQPLPLAAGCCAV